MFEKLCRRLALFVFGLCLSASAQASFHLWQIAELFSTADGTIQFIRLSTPFFGQQLLAGQSIRSSSGAVEHIYTFPSDLPGGDTANRSLLVATQGFAALNLVTPDYVVPDGFLSNGGGTVNFAGVDFFSHASLPADGVLSLNRNGTTQINSPQNFAGASGSFVPLGTGWWWNPDEGGRGFAIEKRGNRLFMAGYLYDDSGRATWVAAGPGAMNGADFSAPLNVYGGGQTLTGAYRPPAGPTAIGAIDIRFADANNGTLTWPGGTIPIRRFDIVAGGAATTPPAGTPEAGWWWNPDEGGRGFAVEIQNRTLFMAGYMYDASGEPIWYAFGPAETDGGAGVVYRGSWTQYGNGQTLTGAYRPPTVVDGSVGGISIEFDSPKSAMLTLPDGRRIPLTRFAF